MLVYQRVSSTGAGLCFLGLTNITFQLDMLIDLGPGELGSPFRSLENHIIALIIVAQKNPMPGVRCYSYIKLHRIFGWIGQTGATGCFWFHVQPRIFHCHLWVGHRRLWKFYHVIFYPTSNMMVQSHVQNMVLCNMSSIMFNFRKVSWTSKGMGSIPSRPWNFHHFDGVTWDPGHHGHPFCHSSRRPGDSEKNPNKDQKGPPVAETGSPTSFWSQENLFFPILNLIYV